MDERDYLMHYGRKGMKWHKHIFGDKKKPEQTDRFEKTKTRHRHVPHADVTIGSITYNGGSVQVVVDKNRDVTITRLSRQRKTREHISPTRISYQNKRRRTAEHHARRDVGKRQRTAEQHAKRDAGKRSETYSHRMRQQHDYIVRKYKESKRR